MPLQTSELLQPIEGDNPGGADIRYEPVFDRLKWARTEEEDLPTGDWVRQRKTADYALVVKFATEVLSKQSKDLQVAAWLTEALLKREGFAGLRSGIEVLRALLVEFWEHLYPEVEDGDLEYRAAPLEWVAQYLLPSIRLVPIDAAGHTIFDYRDAHAVGYEKDADTSSKRDARRDALESGKLSAEQFDDAFDATPKAWYKQLIANMDAALAAIGALENASVDRFHELAPRYGPLRDAIGEVRQPVARLLARKLEADPDPIELDTLPSQPPPAEGRSSPAESAASPTDPCASVGVAVPAAPDTRAEAEARIAAAARFLRAERATDPSPYLLLRGFRWGELRAQPVHVEPKLLAAPPTELRARLRGLLLDGRWSKLLEASEDVMSTPFGRGWLDLQRYVLTACSGLGSEYDQVAATIRGALDALLRDVPQLPSLVLMDDTPTANAETQDWLRELEPATSPPAGATEPGEPVTDRRAYALPHGSGPRLGASHRRGPYERALERVRAGEPEQAIEILIREAAHEKSARERFMRRSQAAAIMVECGREAVALPILEDLQSEIDKHTLDEWEAGDTIAQPLGLLYRCLRQLQGESSTTEALYLRICRLDPLQAIQIAGQSAQ